MRSEAEIVRDDLRSRSIGPRGSALVLGATGPEIFFKVEWTDEIKLVAEASRHDEMLDSTTQWIFLNTEPTRSCGLSVAWPGLGIETVLFFELPKWRHELEILRAGQGIVVLVSEDMKGMDMIVKGIAFEAQADDFLWDHILRD